MTRGSDFDSNALRSRHRSMGGINSLAALGRVWGAQHCVFAAFAFESTTQSSPIGRFSRRLSRRRPPSWAVVRLGAPGGGRRWPQGRLAWICNATAWLADSSELDADTPRRCVGKRSKLPCFFLKFKSTELTFVDRIWGATACACPGHARPWVLPSKLQARPIVPKTRWVVPAVTGLSLVQGQPIDAYALACHMCHTWIDAFLPREYLWVHDTIIPCDFFEKCFETGFATLCCQLSGIGLP